jgi:hypothetical protein
MGIGSGRAGVAVLGGLLALAVVTSGARTAAAQPGFPNVPVWSYSGAWHRGAGGDTIEVRPRTITVRWMRDPLAEARPDFGGYRIYRATSNRDTSSMLLVRRFSRQFIPLPYIGDSAFLWHFPAIDANTPLEDRIATFVDPDSTGRFIKVCRVRNPQNDPNGACISLRDSVLILAPPPGPHDGFRTWYSVTYEARDISYFEAADMTIPDTLDNYVRCGTPGDPTTCPNLNHKAANVSNDVWEPRAASADPDSHVFARAVEPTGGPTANLGQVGVVPNPYRASEAWNQLGAHEMHFINLPPQAKIRIFTVAGDLVRELDHNDPIRDFARWDLKNGVGNDVSSGIYMYRVEAQSFSHQSRFIVIR